jgi:hypothetical protein
VNPTNFFAELKRRNVYRAAGATFFESAAGVLFHDMHSKEGALAKLRTLGL